MERLDENFGKSEDLIAKNLEHMKQLFPDAFAEGKIDFDVLKQLLGDYIESNDEKYGLNWFGKKKARQFALTPSLGTLRPCPEESVDWDTTKNIMIEGDNLEVLKILQKSLTGRVKLIYIDPPYNTGKDFVYPDNYQDSIKNYHDLTGQTNSGIKVSSNLESSGRYHTDWLNMMYPRLLLARNLLKNDGVIFISIDDNEVANLRTICDNIFGEENFVNLIAVKMSESTGVKMAHVNKRFPKLKEYIALYKKRDIEIMPIVVPKDKWDNEYKHLICDVSKDELQSLKDIMSSETITSDSIVYADSICSKMSIKPVDYLFSSNNLTIPEDKQQALYDNAWRIVRDVATTGIAKQLADNKKQTTSSPFFVIVTPQGKMYLIKRDYNDLADQPRIKLLFADLYLSSNPGDFWQDIKTTGLDNEGEVDFKNGKKPIKMIQRMLQATSDNNDIVLDFFAGSGTLGQAVMDLNTMDNKRRSFILVQLQEQLDIDNKDQKETAQFCDSIDKPRSIVEITKERLRRAGNKIRKKNPLTSSDIGFRVFKLDASNIRAWDPSNSDIEVTIEEYTNHVKSDRSEQDILFELLLKLGLDLSVQIESKEICQKKVYNIGFGVLLVCLSTSISGNEIEPLAQGMIEWIKSQNPEVETVIVFRDSAFENDVAKTNITAIFNQHGFSNIRSL